MMVNKYFSLFSILATVLVLGACSGGSGEDVQQNVDPGNSEEDTGLVYNGPEPTLSAIGFKRNIWDNLAVEDKCGACHVQDNTSPDFVRTDDINLAYEAAFPLINLSSPASSRIVEKVGGGHNCWLTEPSACADTIINFIEKWAAEEGVEIEEAPLTAPPEKEVGTSRTFPNESTSYANTVYPLVSEYCSQCHSENSSIQQQPYIASSDISVAYDAAKSKINLDDPGSSRLVVRLKNEFHNCWENDCVGSANEMQAAIQAFSDTIELTEVNPDLVISRAVGLPDGIIASEGGRVKTDVIALYEFKTGSGSVAFDTSGVEPLLPLNLTGNVEWVGSWGIRINTGNSETPGKAQGATSVSSKLHSRLQRAGEYSIEAWVVPANVSQDGPARIITYSAGPEDRNFTLGQTLYNYNFLARSATTNENGMPSTNTPDADEVLQATLQHVVATYHPIRGRKIFVNGELVEEEEDREAGKGGNLNDWNSDYALALGSEVDGSDAWQGTVRFLAIHEREMTIEQIVHNYNIGVGQKFFLLFGVSHLIDMDDAYVVFEVQQFDDYSYLFNKPFFTSLGEQTPQNDILIDGIRIGVNGKEATIGQSFANVNTTINSNNFSSPRARVPLSDLGAIIELDKGSDNDQFFLSFDGIGNSTFNRPADPAAPLADAADIEGQADIGLKLFGEINATIAKVTTVPPPTTSVATVYETVKQQLPTAESMDGFLAAHQAGVMQLSVAYCTALVSDTSRRATYFNGFDFSASYAQAFDDAGRSQIISPLLEGLVANNIDLGDDGVATLATQPSPDDVILELNNLIDNMSTADTATTVIAVCAAAVGNAVMLLQ